MGSEPLPKEAPVGAETGSPQPSCLQTTRASSRSHPSSQTVPHWWSWRTSTRPAQPWGPSTSRSVDASLWIEDKSLWVGDRSWWVGERSWWVRDRSLWVGDRSWWVWDRSLWIEDKSLWVGDRSWWVGERS
ncbi:PREDICTED: coiled-coil domain-containing protein 70-like, partial [Merops nubicus]|uniref:coiled-coil domain-containing protein 70-like n=1 Tax=Merops nubicus TaxID=57421 RepID=UPI0004F05630